MVVKWCGTLSETGINWLNWDQTYSTITKPAETGTKIAKTSTKRAKPGANLTAGLNTGFKLT